MKHLGWLIALAGCRGPEAPSAPEQACAAPLPVLAKEHTANTTRIYLVPLEVERDAVRLGTPALLTTKSGYVNQPAFDGTGLYFTWRPPGSQADVWFHDRRTGGERAVTCSSEEEYVPAPTPDRRGLTAVRIAADTSKTLVELGLDGRIRRTLFPEQRAVATYRWVDDHTIALIASHPDAPLELLLGDPRTGELARIAEHVRPSMTALAGALGYVDDREAVRVMRLDLATRTSAPVIALPDGADQVVGLADGSLLSATGTRLVRAATGATTWSDVADLAGTIDGEITRLVVDPAQRTLAIVAHTPG